MLKLSSNLIKTFLSLCVLGVSSMVFAAPPAIWGSKHIIPYMPYGPTAAQIIYVSNPNPNSVEPNTEINVSAFDDQGNIYKFTLDNYPASANTVTKLAPEITYKLSEAGFIGGKVHFELTIGVPEAIVYASYNIGSSDRGYVEVKKEYLLTNPNPTEEIVE